MAVSFRSPTRTRIVKIGNSQGIRIPKPILEQLGLLGEVELEVQDSQLVIRSVQAPRQGWQAQFQQLAALAAPEPDPLEQALLAETDLSLSDWDEDEWTW